MGKSIRTNSVWSIFFLVLLFLSLGSFCFYSHHNEVLTAFAANTEDNKIQKPDIYIHAKDINVNVPFEAKNLFPGDLLSQKYCVGVLHSDDVDIKFSIHTKDTKSSLTEVINVRVSLLDGNETLYEGLLKDFPESINCSVSTSETTESLLNYKIDVWLDVHVGNEYQNKNIIADFIWWTESSEALEAPKTGDSTTLFIWVSLAVITFFTGIFLYTLKKASKGRGYEKL